MTVLLGRFSRAAKTLALPSLALFLGIAFAVFGNTWVDPSHRVVGVPGDSYLFIWFLRWTAFALTHHQNPLISTYMNFPLGLNLMWNTAVILPGSLLSPVSVTVGPTVAYNLLATVGPALSAWTATVAIRRWVPSTIASTAGGLLYGFSPYMFAQSLGHLHMTMAVYPPLVVMLLGEILASQRGSPVLVGLLLGALTAAQLLISEEIVASTAIAAATAIFWLVLLHRFRLRGRLRYALTSLAVAVTVAIVLAAIPLWVQFFGPRRVFGDAQAHNVYVSDLLNFVIPTGFQALSPHQALEIAARFTGNNSEWNAYLGLPLILLLVGTSISARKEPIFRLAALVGLTMAILSLGPRLHIEGIDTGVHLPYRAVDRLPVLGSMLPSRLSLYVDLAAAMLLAGFVKRVLAVPSRPMLVAGIATGIVALAPLFPALPYFSASAATPDFFTTTVPRRIQQGQVLLIAPAFGAQSPRPMLWQAQSGMRFRITAGYFLGPLDGKPLLGSTPSPLSTVMGPIGDGQAAPRLEPATRAAMLDDMSTKHVAAVVVGPMDNQAETIKLFIDLLGRRPEQNGGVYVWWLS